MQRIITRVICIVGILFFSLASAVDDQYSISKVGILDVQLLMTKTGAADRAIDKIRKQYLLENRALEKEQNVLNLEIKKYNKSVGKLEPDEIKHWQRKINAMQSKLQQERIILQEKIKEEQKIETQKIIYSFFNLVSKIAEKNHLDLVLFKDVTPYNDIGAEVQNITNEVIELSRNKNK